MIVYAKTQPDKGAKGITAFIIEKGMPVRRRLCGVVYVVLLIICFFSTHAA